MKLTTHKIASYVPTLSTIAHDHPRTVEEWNRQCAAIGGFNPGTRKLTRLCCTTSSYIGEHLDHITAAVEAGVVKKGDFVGQLFASDQDYLDFMKYVSAYPGRIHDRWHRALSELACVDPAASSLLSTAEMLSALRGG